MTLKKTLEWIVAGTVFLALLTPFVFYTELYFPFITAKAYYFRALVEIGFLAWLGLALLDPMYRPKKSLVLWTVTAFIAIVGLTSWQGVNPYQSFWSNFERMEGYITFIHLFAFFLITTSILRTQRIWNYFLNTAVVIGVLQVGWAAFQVGGVLAVGMSQNRIDGTLGNASYLAIYMVFTFFLALFLLVRHQGETWVRYWYIIAMLLATLAVFWTATRGSLLGLAGGVVLALVIMTLLDRTKTVLRNSTLAVLGVVAILAILVIGFKESPLVQNVHALRRIADISFTETTTIARFYNWNTAWQGIKERTWFGYGLGNYGVIFDVHYDPKMWNQEQWFDRVHNIIFDWLVAGGFVGLLSYVSLFAVLLYYIWRPSNTFTNAERSVLTGLIAAYCFHNLFVFDNLVSYIYFMILLAYVHGRVTADVSSISSYKVEHTTAVVAATLLLIAAPLTVWAVNAPSYQQGILLIDALRIRDINQLPKITELFAQSLDTELLGTTEVRQQLMIFAGQVVAVQGGELAAKQALVQLAAEQMQQEINIRPNDPKFLALAGQFLAQTGNLEESLKLFERAVSLSPNKQSLHQPIIEVLFKLNRVEEAFTRAYDVHMIEPSNDTTWRQYVRSALRAGKKDQYDALIAEAFATGRGDRVIGLVLQNLESDPNNVQVRASLAIAYYQAGMPEEAIAAFKDLGERFPDAKVQADSLIKKIEAGEPLQ